MFSYSSLTTLVDIIYHSCRLIGVVIVSRLVFPLFWNSAMTLEMLGSLMRAMSFHRPQVLNKGQEWSRGWPYDSILSSGHVVL